MIHADRLWRWVLFFKKNENREEIYQNAIFDCDQFSCTFSLSSKYSKMSIWYFYNLKTCDLKKEKNYVNIWVSRVRGEGRNDKAQSRSSRSRWVPVETTMMLACGDGMGTREASPDGWRLSSREGFEHLSLSLLDAVVLCSDFVLPWHLILGTLLLW